MPQPPSKVLISSTALDLPTHRDQVRDACLQSGMFPIMMEHLPASDAEAIPASLKMVDEADIYLLILANRYGYVAEANNPANISVTEWEYNRAVERNIPRLVFVMHGDHPVKASDVETGEAATKLKRFKERLMTTNVVKSYTSPDDLRAHVINSLSGLQRHPALSSERESFIHSLPVDQKIEGREVECEIILREISGGEHRVVAFAAPGGFGKTALLTKVAQRISPDGRALIEKITLLSGDAIETHISACLHLDCRSGLSLSSLFSRAGRLLGEEQAFQDIYNNNASLSDKLVEIFRRLSPDTQTRSWFVFDNFEPLLNAENEISDGELREFFSRIFAGGHGVRALIVGREVPRLSRREKVAELRAVGENLFDGLPLADCVAYLKKSHVPTGVSSESEQSEAVLKEFALRVYRIPLALVWAVGYLSETGYTLQDILGRTELFADFEKEQANDAANYENKGLKRLHYEQLTIQREKDLPVLRLLAFFKRAVPLGVLEHLLGEIELKKSLVRLERNKLLTRSEATDSYTKYVNDPREVNLYALHPVVCENEFFVELPDRKTLYEESAIECWKRAVSAHGINRFAYAVELFDCAVTLYERLVNEEQQGNLANDLAAAYMNKGVALDNLTRLAEALAEYEKAIAIRERLVNEEQQGHLSNNLATAYMNKGVALNNLTRLADALAEYEKAIAILERLGNEVQQGHMANDLAGAYTNKGVALRGLSRLAEALAEYEKAIAILARLVNEEQQGHLANDLAKAYMNKGVALYSMSRLAEALAEYEKAIAILARLVNEEQQGHLANDLAKAYLNKGNALQGLSRLAEALAEYEKAIAILARLVNEEQQGHLANDLAAAYMNKALVLEQQQDWDTSLMLYGKALGAKKFCVEDLRMTWLTPELLEILRYRMMTFLDLRRWHPAGQDVLSILELVASYTEDSEISDERKEAANSELAHMISSLRELNDEERQLLYSELGDKADRIRSLISA